MTKSEIQTQVILGSHSAVKAFWAPVMESTGAKYNGVGGLSVFSADKTAALARWNEIRAALPKSFRLSPISRTYDDCGFYEVASGWRFSIEVR